VAVRSWFLCVCTLAFAATAAAHGDATSSAAAAPGELAAPLAEGLYFTPAERQLFRRAEAGVLGNADLLEASLAAAGVHDRRTRDPYLRRFQAWCQALRGQCPRLDERQKAEAVFVFLHREILHGKYDLDCSRVTDAIDRGDFNCISSTVLFTALAHAVGLTVTGAERPGHVLAVVVVDGRRMAVETTCRDWFDILDDPQRLARFVPPTGAPTSTGPPQTLRDIDAAGLVAITYYNEGVDALQQDRYAESIAANFKAWRLDPRSAAARGNLLAGVNNWSLDLAADGRFAEAMSVLRAGSQLAPDHRNFSANMVAVYQRWTEMLARDRRYGEALAVLDEGAAMLPANPYFGDAASEVYRRWASDLAGEGRVAEVAALLAEARQRFPGRQDLVRAEAEVLHAVETRASE
jgi:tetratricopeptide (TPR) repeat protein